MSLFGESSAHKQARYQKQANEQLQGYNLENMEIQQGYNIENMQRQYGYEQALMQQQFDYNQRAFMMENEYNSPSAQRQRMLAAGLNPNWSDTAAIGQMDSSVTPASPSSTTPSGGAYGGASMPTANTTQDMLALGQAYQGIMESRSRIALNEAEKEKAQSEARVNDVESSERPLNYQRQRRLIDTQQWYNQSQTAYTDSLNETQHLIYENYQREKDAIINQLKSQHDLNYAQAEEIYYLMRNKGEALASEAVKNYASAYRDKMEVQLGFANVNLRGQELQVRKQELSELHRHNVSVEQYERFANVCYGKLQQSLTSGQDIKNKMWDIERIVMVTAKHEGIPQQMAFESLQNLRAQTYYYEEEAKKAHANAEESENWFTRMFMSAFGLVSAGVAAGVVRQSPAPPKVRGFK